MACAGINLEINGWSTAYLPRTIPVIVSAVFSDPSNPRKSTTLANIVTDKAPKGPEKVGSIESGFKDGVNIFTDPPNCTGNGTLKSCGIPINSITPCTALYPGAKCGYTKYGLPWSSFCIYPL